MQKQELGPNQLKWIEALESGKWKQGRMWLCTQHPGGDEYCCLGVGCRVFGIDERSISNGHRLFGVYEKAASAPPELIECLALKGSYGEFYGISSLRGGSSLASANDSGATFAEIAAFCREHPEAVFTEPR